MRTIVDVKLQELLPSSLLQDNQIVKLCESINNELKLLMIASDDVKSNYSIDSANQSVLDHIAWMLNSDLYFIGENINQKKDFVKKTIEMHRKKGTKYALLEALRILVPDVSISEWFEYGGEPFHFKIQNISDVSLKTLCNIVFLINTIKNLRSWLDNNFETEEEDNCILINGLFSMLSMYRAIDMRDLPKSKSVTYIFSVFKMEVGLDV